MNRLSSAEHRSADGARLQDLKGFPAPPSHPVCQLVVATLAQANDCVDQVSYDPGNNKEDDGIDSGPSGRK